MSTDWLFEIERCRDNYASVKEAEQKTRLRMYVAVAEAVHAGHSQRQALQAAGMADTYWVHLCKALTSRLEQCLEDGCGNTNGAEGYCPDHSERKALPKEEKMCDDPGCEQKHKAKGLCNTGYQRMRRSQKTPASAG